MCVQSAPRASVLGSGRMPVLFPLGLLGDFRGNDSNLDDDLFHIEVAIDKSSIVLEKKMPG